MAKALIVATSTAPWMAFMAMAMGADWLEPPFVIGAALGPLGLLVAIAAAIRGRRFAWIYVAAETVAVGWLILACCAAWSEGSGPIFRLLELLDIPFEPATARALVLPDR